MDKKLLTHSSMTCAKTCLRKFYFRYVRGLVKQRDTTPRRVGTLFHLGVELGQPAEHFDYPAWCEEEEDRYKWDCDQALAAAMVEAYLEYWDGDVLEVLASEVEFQVPVVNPESGRSSRTFQAAGKIDKVVQVPAGVLESFPDGCVALLEYKTTSDELDPSGTYWQRLKMDQQISHYMMGAAASSDLPEVQTVVYDVTRRSDKKPKGIEVLDEDGLKIVLDDETGERVYNKAAKGKEAKPRQTGGKGMTVQKRPETPEEFKARVKESMLDDPDRYFCRREVPRLETDLNEYAWELWAQQRIVGTCYNLGAWFRNTSACIFYNSPCDYFELCTQGVDPEEDHAPLGFEFKRAHAELAEREGGDDE